MLTAISTANIFIRLKVLTAISTVNGFIHLKVLTAMRGVRILSNEKLEWVRGRRGEC